MNNETVKKPTLVYSLFILAMVVVIIATGMLVFGASIQIMMFITLITLIPFVSRLGHSYQSVEKSIFQSMLQALQPSMILLAVGVLIGSWMASGRSEEHTSELQSRENLVCRLLLEKKKT